MGTPTIDSFTHDSADTTDGTPTTVATIPLAVGAPITLMDFALEIRGTEAATGDCWIRLLRGSIKRVGAGAAVLVGATTAENRRDAGSSTWGATASASGNDLLIQVTGQAAKTIVWRVVERATR